MHPGRAVVVTLTASLVVLVLVFVLVLSDRDLHLAGTNNVFDRFPVATLERGDEVCERHELVPGDAAAVRFAVEPDPGARLGELRVRVLDGGHVISDGRRTGGEQVGSIDVPLDSVPRTLADAQVCLENRGAPALTLRGYEVQPERVGFTLNGDQVGQQLRLAYVRAEPESWWSLAGVVFHRLGVGKGGLFGGWVPFAWLAGLLAMGAVAVSLVLRGARS